MKQDIRELCLERGLLHGNTRPMKYIIENGCWEIVSHKARHGFGYPLIKIKGQMKRVSRLVWEANYGSIPKGLFVCHKCDNAKCINIDHLFLGTPADNIRDMVTKRRQPDRRGERAGGVKLTWGQVATIRNGHRGMTQREIANIYGVNPSLISLIRSGKIWKQGEYDAADRETLN